jgi:hypothetical protein
LNESPLAFPEGKDFDPSPFGDMKNNNFPEPDKSSESNSLPRDDENLSDEQLSFSNLEHGDLYQIKEEEEEEDSFEKETKTKR